MQGVALSLVTVRFQISVDMLEKRSLQRFRARCFYWIVQNFILNGLQMLDVFLEVLILPQPIILHIYNIILIEKQVYCNSKRGSLPHGRGRYIGTRFVKVNATLKFVRLN